MKLRKMLVIAGAVLTCLTAILHAAADPDCYAKAVAVAKATGSEAAGVDAYVECMLQKEQA